MSSAEVAPEYKGKSSATDGLLPATNQLRADFENVLYGIERPTDRARQVVMVAEHLRIMMGADIMRISNPTERRKQVASKLFVTSITYLSRDRIRDDLKASGKPRGQALKDLVSNRHDMQEAIEIYHQDGADKDHLSLYEDLEALVQGARALIYNDRPESLTKRKSWQNNGVLGMLAEIKIVNALSNQDWPGTKLAPPALDRYGIDVKVPRRGGNVAGLQIKAVLGAQDQIQIIGPDRSAMPIPKIVVPMNPELNDPFESSVEDTSAINQYMYTAPNMPIKRAA